MKFRLNRQLLFLIALGALGAGWARDVAAAIVIPTNQNGGADAEVREEEINPSGTGVPQGNNRGANFELATRLIDRTTGGSSDRSSVDYLKFDISGVTLADLAANPYAAVRLHIGNTNVNGSRQIAPSPADPNTMVEMQFNLRGLTNFALDNWAENTITWYNAPGITPDSANTPAQDPGKYNFNSDLPVLGTFKLPTVGSQNHLAVGSAVDYVDSAFGPLHDLIVAAKTAGRTHVTLAVHHGLDGFQAGTGELPGTTPTSMLNFNYIFIPKEVLAINNLDGRPNGLNDTNYDPDTTDMIAGGPSPFLNASNDMGQFSPKLILGVNPIPEPSSMLLLGLASLVAVASGRRRK